MPTLPVTVVSGFLGAGKTSLLNQLIRQLGGRRVAVLVNRRSLMSERSAEGTGQATLRTGQTALARDALSAGALIELHGGCVCCSRRDDFIAEVSRVARSGRYDALLVEASALAEPLPLAMAFDHDDPDEELLNSVAHVDSMITVVDARNFLTDWDSAVDLRALGVAVDHLDARTPADVLAEQVEFANQIVINKTDLVSGQELERLLCILERLNPEAELVTTMFGAVEAEMLVDTGLFERSQLSPPPDEEDSENTALGIASFVYRARRPFHPARLWACLHERWPGVMRSKGLFWLATRLNDSGLWSQAGHSCSHQSAGRWWSSVPRDFWPDEPAIVESIEAEFEGEFGDRRQEIVVVGQGLDREALRARLDACLLDDSEMRIGPMGWSQLPDPFPDWELEDVDETDLPPPVARRETPLA
jgi:G3E family GTPase